MKAAWIVTDSASWIVYDDRNCDVVHRGPYFHTPVTALIDWIYASASDYARKVLRSRIYLNYEPSLRCRETIRVAAKRFTIQPVTDTAIDTCDFTNSMKLSDWINLGLGSVDPGYDLTQLIDGPRYLRNRSIRASLVDRSGVEWFSAVNTNARFKMRHAEINLILQLEQALHQDKDITSRLIGSEMCVSLQPCRMCAAWIKEILLPLGVSRVLYSEPELGRMGKAPWLDEGSKNWIMQMV